MKRFLISLICATVMGAPAFAADVAARMTCDEIAAAINELTAMEDLDDADAARLESLRGQQRRSCTKSASGRRTNSARTGTAKATSVKADEVAAIATVNTDKADNDVADIDSFLAKKAENCKKLWDAIGQLKMDKADANKIAEMQSQYDADCEDKVVAAESEPDPEEVAIAEAERINALIDAGYCADGTKPNKFGCCTGEKFTDMGDLVFACCPEDGGQCFPPMTNGNAI